MLRESFAAGALVAAAFIPFTGSQAQADEVRTAHNSAAPAICASADAPKCKWMETKKNRCLMCKKKKGGWTQQYCEPLQRHRPGEMKPKEPKEGILCKADFKEDGTPCMTCTNLKTGKVTSDTCKPAKPAEPK